MRTHDLALFGAAVLVALGLSPTAARAQIDCTDFNDEHNNQMSEDCGGTCVYDGTDTIVCSFDNVYTEDDFLHGVTDSSGQYPVIWGDWDDEADPFCCDYTSADMTATGTLILLRVYTYDGNDSVWLNKTMDRTNTEYLWQTPTEIHTGDHDDVVLGSDDCFSNSSTSTCEDGTSGDEASCPAYP
jgi:hypothetical protein